MKNGLLVVMLLILAIGVSCNKDENPVAPEKFGVKYTVTGTATSVSVTYENGSGGTSQEADVDVPWSYTFPSDVGAETFVYISAQNQGQTGTVTTTILRNGETYKTSTSQGEYVIASASGTI